MCVYTVFSHMLSHFILEMTLLGKYYYYEYHSSEEIKLRELK